MTVLTFADRERLAAILGRLGSDQAGERDAAASAAIRLLAARGATWADVILAPPEPGRALASPSDWRTDLAFARRHLGEINDDSAGFILNIAGRQSLSEKQLRWLGKIVTTLRGRGLT